MGWVGIGACGVVWLVFFPNAPYLVTDLIHLLKPESAVPYWYDLLLIVTFAWTGCFLGLASLILMQAVVRKITGLVASRVFAGGILCLSGFGVYLGRFLRSNSWEVFANPSGLLVDVAERLRHPLAHMQTYVFSALLSLFLVAAYLMLVSLAGFHSEAQSQQELPEG